MESQDGTATTWLEELLAGGADGYEFAELVRLLQKSQPGKPVGTDAMPEDESIRFEPELTLGFPDTEVAGLSRSENQYNIYTRFLSMYGSTGVLPWPYTEKLMESCVSGNHAKAFLDMFNHRMISLFFRAGAKYRTELLEADSDKRPGGALSRYLQCIVGLGTAGLRGGFPVPTGALLRYSGLLSQRPRSAAGLETILSDLMNGIRVEVKQFVGERVEIPRHDRSSLDAGKPRRVGKNMLVGQSCYRPQAGFQVRLKKLNLATFLELLPGTRGNTAVFEIIRLFSGPEHRYSVQLEIEKSEVPRCRLARCGKVEPRLGWSTWLLGRRPAGEDGKVKLHSSRALMSTKGDERWDPMLHPICRTS